MSKANNEQEQKCKFKSKIGGQALIEGIMMRGIDKSAMACRLPNGEIDVEEWSIKNGKNAPWYRKTPFIRGTFNFVTSLADGYKCLSKSADKAMEFEEEEMTPFEKKLEKLFGEKLMPILTGVAMVFGIALAFGLFIFLPAAIVKLLGGFIDSNMLKTLAEGIVKIALFVVYLAFTSKLKDIQRTYEYHGAEHKTIACYESGEELTVENIKKHPRFHPRCGTSFLLIVLIISILLFSVLRLPWDNLFLRIVFKLILMPFVVGISYEIIKLAGRYVNPFTRAISAPGLWLQRLTTKEPDDKQIEVAIAAMLPVIPVDKEDDKW